jgi:hypothetical protein
MDGGSKVEVDEVAGAGEVLEGSVMKGCARVR